MNLVKRLGMLLGGIFLCGQNLAGAAPVHIQVQHAATSAVLMSVARLGGLNLLLADNIGGTVTVNVQEEPEAILRFLTASQGLLLEKYDNVYVVTTPERSNELRSVHVYKARYALPADLAKVANLSLGEAGKKSQTPNDNKASKKSKLETLKKGTEERPARVMVDEAAGAVIFYGTAAEAQKLRTALEQVDVPAKQVSIEAKVVALSKSASRNLGVEWEWSKLPQYPERKKTYHYAGKNNERVDYETNRRYNGKTDEIPGVIQFGHGPEGQPFEFYFGLKLNSLIADGKAKILARPNITTIQGQEAVIKIGGEVPVPTQTMTETATTNTVTYRQAGIVLRCTPRVNADGRITVEVHTDVSTPELVTDLKAFRFQRRSADTTVRLRDGETMVIGGLIGSEESHSLSKLPFFSDLPILGAFFKNIRHSHVESEVMIFLKAHVL
ncbi:type IV pilus assembly protein PilQ [Selenomonas ruminantium]|uniref:Type IV pilus assembly protein PilQ n=1 Tax=Selenomonas ruminantium TaxID=971 RepID=A0A1M6V1J9_SELRU|nr:secretin N-terminal domain-containing protein [Selenomonas ruminantium]SHK75320.1 type IV pilus assembly protein PilQ [Selenomonas ruminantium]